MSNELIAEAREAIAVIEGMDAFSVATTSTLRRLTDLISRLTTALKAAEEKHKPSIDDKNEKAYLIYYDDTEVRSEVFTGCAAEAAARKVFKDRQVNWSCYLFEQITDASGNPLPHPPVEGE